MTLVITGAAACAPVVAQVPVTLEADSLKSVPSGETKAIGNVELRQGEIRIRADTLRYRRDIDRAAAEGGVRIESGTSALRGPAAELTLGTYEGWIDQPDFDFLKIGTRGSAARIDFTGPRSLRATDARYTSCPRDDGTPDREPDWYLTARSVAIDLDANEGRADGAVLRFLGVPILAAPALSFPVTDDRKSGWLPPTVGIDSRSGFEFSIPYYWNLAPNYDATIAPRVSTRRGLAAAGEFRYLLHSLNGSVNLNWLPHDIVANRSRYALELRHDQRLPFGVRARVDAIQVSDDAWWKDFSHSTSSLTPRLLPQVASLVRPFAWRAFDGDAYFRLQRWQVLQDTEVIVPPYARSPQIGARAQARFGAFDVSLGSEANHFTLADRLPGDLRPNGWRWEARAAVEAPWRRPGFWLVPRLALNLANYRTDRPLVDGRRTASRVVPSFSLDAGLELERGMRPWFGRPLRQTLEPRLLYVYTPYRRQDQLPNFDSFGKEFNFSSIYSANAFSGGDRISDANQITAGVTSRLIDPATGAEVARVGVAQRYRFSDQRVAPEIDGRVDGATQTQTFSDLLLLGSTTVLPHLALDAALQYSADNNRLRRSIIGATWRPRPFHTLNARYRLARGLSEQMEVGWQWPLYTREADSSRQCGGALYTVGRINYSMRDSRITDSILGFEYDAGCWITRIVAERLSTGRTEATTRLMLQLELVGLSRLGSNPLRTLKDNIPGYQLLREERGDTTDLSIR